MQILKLTIQNFKRIKKFSHTFNGGNWDIHGPTGIGKSTTYDAFVWLMADSNSEGDSRFSLRPLDENNNQNNDVTVTVEAELLIGPDTVTFKKQNKKSTNGFTNDYWIDGVPKKASEFKAYIKIIASEEVFKILTSVHYFGSDMHWEQRRNILLAVAGNDVKPKGYDALFATAGDRTLDEYKKVVSDNRKLLVNERDEIEPRIDELENTITSYTETDGLLSLEDERDAIKAEIAMIDDEIKEVEKTREVQNELKEKRRDVANQMKAREIEIKSDKSYVAEFAKKQGELKKVLAQMETDLSTMAETGKQIVGRLNTAKANLAAKEKETAVLRVKFNDLKTKTVDTHCYACKQVLPSKAITENKKALKDELAEIAEIGKALSSEVESLKKEVIALESEYQTARQEYDDYNKTYQDTKKITQQELKKLQDQIDNAKAPDHEQDETWLSLKEEYGNVFIPAVDEEKLSSLRDDRQQQAKKLDDSNKAFAQIDNIKNAKKRIEELEKRQRVLSQDIANCDKELKQIADYKKAESDLLVKMVNCKFEHVKFKLFEQQVNGELRPCCEVLFGGVPYSDMSTGQKIYAGIDIISALSRHYGKHLPLFVDNAESLTLPIVRTGQTIRLVADVNAKRLTLKEGE